MDSVLNSTFCLPYLKFSDSPPDANGNLPCCTSLPKVKPAPLLAQPSTPKHRCTLGSVEGMARTDARSDHAVLELFCCFFLSREKSKTRIIGKRSHYLYFTHSQHPANISSQNL